MNNSDSIEEHQCLRCGWCCEIPDIDIEEDYIKPIKRSCRYLSKVLIDNECVIPASCNRAIKPLECKEFSPDEGPCEIGKKRWKKIMNNNPNIKLPKFISSNLK